MLGNKTRISPHLAKQDSKSGKTVGNQKRKHQDRDHQNQRRSQEPCLHLPTETVGGDLVRRRLLCKTRHERPELDDESEPLDKYQPVEVRGLRRTWNKRPPEEYDIEDDTKEIEVDDLDMAEVLKLGQNEGLDPTAVEVGIRKEMKGPMISESIKKSARRRSRSTVLR